MTARDRRLVALAGLPGLLAAVLAGRGLLSLAAALAGVSLVVGLLVVALEGRRPPADGRLDTGMWLLGAAALLGVVLLSTPLPFEMPLARRRMFHIVCALASSACAFAILSAWSAPPEEAEATP